MFFNQSLLSKCFHSYSLVEVWSFEYAKTQILLFLQLEKAHKLLNRRIAKGVSEGNQDHKDSGKEDGEAADDLGVRANVSLLDQHAELKKKAESKTKGKLC